MGSAQEWIPPETGEGGQIPAVVLWAGGSMVCDVPAYLMGNKGGAYKYGSTKVGGIRNMISNGEVLRSIIVDRNELNVLTGGGQGPPYRLLLGGTGVGKYEQIENTKHVQLVTIGQRVVNQLEYSLLNVNGEMCYRETTLAQYGAYSENFTMGGITATVTAGSKTLTFSASIAAIPLTFGYAYTPMFNAPRIGDLVAITQGGNIFYHRLKSGSAANWEIYPAWNGTNAAGLTCQVMRTGYGSFSRVQWISGGPGNTDILYYVGNLRTNNYITGQGLGTIEAVIGGTGHFMCPIQTPSGSLLAADLIYFKNFLLYGGGSAIGWSVAGFPTTPALAFGANDFPAANVNASFNNDTFVAFEVIGDQLYAWFEESCWIVQATGSVPEFTFHRLPQIPGVLNRGIADPQECLNTVGYTRPICASAASIYFGSQQGIMEMRGAPPAAEISVPVNTYEFPETSSTYELTYDPSSDSLLWMDGHAIGLIYRRGLWSELDLTGEGSVRAVTAGIKTDAHPFEKYRAFTIGYWGPVDGKMRLLSSSLDSELGTTAGVSVCSWTWASPIVNVSRLPKTFRFGGIHVLARGPSNGAGSIGGTFYQGTDPNNMVSAGTFGHTWADGPLGIERVFGETLDAPFLGVVLTGSYWTELAGVVLYNAAAQLGR